MYKKFISIEPGALFYFVADDTLCKRTEAGFAEASNPNKWGIARDDASVIVVSARWAPFVGFLVRHALI